MDGQELFGLWVGSALCIDEYEWFKLSEVRRNNWQNFATRLTEPDFDKLAKAFGVSRGAASDYFQGGSFDPIGVEVIRIALHRADPEIEDYVGDAFVRRLLIACLKCGVPTDQLLPIENLCLQT